MNKKIQATAIKFIKAVKGKIDFESVEKYVNNIGYKIIFFNTPDGDIEVRRYNKENDVIHNDAFTYCGTAQIIFLNADISAESKLYLLLHELGHIALGHIGDGKLFTRNKRLIDIEADAFTYTVLNPPKSKNRLCVASMIICVAFLFMSNDVEPSDTTRDQLIANTTPTVLSNSDESVYVTPSGAKYHRSDCRYTKDKDCTTFTLNDAKEHYLPCSVCKP